MPDVETNPMFPMLTDALRAGPGSPEWHQAVAKLRAEGLADTDEYKMLVSVREHLASGRDYRSVRAGPGFTRKLMEGIERERQVGSRKSSGLPVANILAVVSVLVIMVVIGYVAYQVVSKSAGAQGAVAELENAYFPTKLLSDRFDAGMPIGWKEVGGLKLEAGKTGLKPASGASAASGATASGAAGGALVSTQAVPSDQPFALEVELKPGKPTEDLIVQVFVATESDFSSDKSTSSNELVWLMQGGRQKVVRGSDNKTLFEGARPEPANGKPVTVRVAVNKEFAVVWANGQKVYADTNGLAAKPRSVGVRFLRVDGSKLVDPTLVQSVSVRVLSK